MSKELLKRSAAEAGLDDRHLKVLTDITQPPLYPAFLWHSAGGYFDEPTTRELAERAVAAAASVDNNNTTSEQTANTNSNTPPPSLSRIKRTTGMVYIMNKQREMADHFAASAHNVPPTAPQDVARYRVPQRGAPDTAVLHQLSQSAANRKLATDERYFPAELLYSGSSSSSSSKKSRAIEIPSGEKLLEPVTSDTLMVDPSLLTTTKVKREEGVDNKGSDDEDDEEDDEPPEIAAEVDVEEEGADYTANYSATDDDESAGDDDGGEATF